MMRLIESVALIVCSVENTRWPVSAAVERGLHGLDVAHLADEDDVGVLAQHPLQRGVEVGGVGADLALVDDRRLVGVEDLDRVLDRHDVLVLRLVDVVDHRAERRRLARAGRAGDEHQTRARARRACARPAAGPSSSNDGISLCTRRSTRPTEPRWRITFTRKRPRPDDRVREVGLARGEELLGALLRHDRERDALGLDRRDRRRGRCARGARRCE